MKDLLKAQIGIGLLAFFATFWIVALNMDYSNIMNSVTIILVQFVATMVIAYIVLTILEWVDIFDLNTNAILTLLVNVTLLQPLITMTI